MKETQEIQIHLIFIYLNLILKVIESPLNIHVVMSEMVQLVVYSGDI